MTYAAILRNGRLEWEAAAPTLPADVPVRVQVTVMEDRPQTKSGKRMAEALERLAALGGLQQFGDPVEWQRTERTDRPMPGRDP